MTQTEEARNNGNAIQTNIEPLVDIGSSELLSNTLDCPLTKFPLDFLHYLYNYYIVCALFSHTYHVTHYVM